MNKLLPPLHLLVVLALILLLTGCKSTRSTLKKPIKEYGFDYLYAKMLENQFNFNFLSAKFSLTYYEDKGKTDLRGQLRMKNDSITWISFSPALGIEAARLNLTDDSIKFINRLNKKYFMGEYDLIDSLLNTTIDFSILQAMIVGNDITSYDVNKFKASIDGGLYRITIQERRKIKKSLKNTEDDARVLVQNIWLNPEDFRIRQVELKELNDGDNKKLDVVYKNYFPVGDQMFPEEMFISITSQKSILIEVKFLKVELDEEMQFPFRVPGKYEKLF
ncbi:MAG: DUF4292 domain-containing protein [bacterium]